MKKIKEILKKIAGFAKNHKKLVIILTIVLVIVLLIVSAIVKTTKAAKEMLNPSVETQVLEKKDIADTVSVTGKIVSSDTREVVVSSASGLTIASIDVVLGDVVKAGDVIATFDTTDVEKDLADAKTSYNESVSQAAIGVDNSARNLQDSQIDATVDAGRNNEDVDLLQRIYDTKVGEYNEADRVYNEAYDTFNDHYSEDDYYDLQDEILDAKEAHDEERVKELEEEFSTISSAKNGLDSAYSSLQAAQSAMESAESNLKSAKENRDDSLRKNASSVASASNSLKSSNLSASTAGMADGKNVRNLEAQLEDCTVKSPIDGVITAIGYKVGEKYKGEALITVENGTAYEISANVDEYDINKVQVGQRVVFKTNATGDEELEGEITEVSPRANTVVSGTGSLNNTSTSVEYPVKMKITSDISGLRLDMTAKVNIYITEVKDVYAVPTEALNTDEDGNSYILVKEDEAEKKAKAKNVAYNDTAAAMELLEPGRRIYVTVGVEGDYYTEIAGEELTDGLEVIVSSNSAFTDIENVMISAGPAGGM
ncbi:MAG: efflux RND transporter periplasmic adaptor subunit [Lachnospiraceae bacterium]|nr:efflux RND transporter periplasmic adaptor subunit [Candidatus Colinaster equi]